VARTCAGSADHPASDRHSPTLLAVKMQLLDTEVVVMLLALAVILAVAWLLGFSVFNVASAAIHLLVVLAVLALIIHFLQGRTGRGSLAS
jgi:hypothetical protein